MMALSPIPLDGGLDVWRKEMRGDTWKFNQCLGVNAPASNAGENVWVQDDWYDLSMAINDAAELMCNILGFWWRPRFFNQRIPLGRGVPFELQTLQTEWGHLQAFGQRGTTLLLPNAAVQYSQSPQAVAGGTGIDDVATITVNMATTPPRADEIQIFFRTADGAYQAADELFQIEPARVSISGNTITITAHRSNFVKPELWLLPYLPPEFNQHNKNTLDPAIAGNFITQVDVYRVYPDATSAVTLLYDPLLRYGCCADDLSVYTQVTGQAMIQDSELGFFRVRGNPCATCDRAYLEAVDIHYYAGYPLQKTGATLAENEANPFLRHALTRLANTYQPREPNTFSNEVLSRYSTDNMYPQINGRDVPTENTPFGMKNGQIEAWRRVKRYALGSGGAL